jgi:hypothetical protein
MIYIPRFVDCFGYLEVDRGIHIQTHTQTRRQQGNRISLLLFFKNKESRLTF